MDFSDAISLYQGVHVIALNDDLNEIEMNSIVRALLHSIHRSNVQGRALFQFNGVLSIDSSFIHSVLRAGKSVELLGGRFAFTGLRPAIIPALVEFCPEAMNVHITREVDEAVRYLKS